MVFKPDPWTLEAFVRRWTERADKANGSGIDPVFDRFIYTYIAFNSLYNAASYVHARKYDALQQHDFTQGGIQHVDPKTLDQSDKKSKKENKNYNSDKFRATVIVVEVCNEKLASFFDSHRNDINQICDCFRSGLLVTKLDKENGQTIPSIDTDKKTIDEIQLNESIEDLLELIYSVRCNLFHGSKASNENKLQETLLKSSTAILRSLIDILLEKVNDELSKSGQT
jgi:hypothetical protein